MFPISNLDLLTVGIATAGNLLLGFAVFFSLRKNVTGVLFFLQTIILSVWGITNYISYQPHDPGLALVLVRLVLFFATPNSIIFLILMHTFPSAKLRMSKRIFVGLLIIMFVVMALTLTPLVFQSIQINPTGAPTPTPGVGIIAFAIVSILSIPLGIFYVIRNFILAKGEERKQFRLLIIGVVLMFCAIVLLNFILPTVYGNSRFIPLSAFFTFPFIIFTAYAILKYKLFNVKVAATALLVFVLAIVTFADIIFSNTIGSILFQSSVFILVLIIGINLIRSVLKEVEQREKIEVQEKELEVANKGQEDLIHIINHQIKGYLTKGRIIFSELLGEPDYGPVNYKAKPMMEEGLKSLTEGVDFVQGVLNASNIETGTFTYTMQSVDLKSLVMEAADKQRENAIKKGLTYDVVIADGNYLTTGDPIQLKEAFRNLIDNSIHYTEKGGIHVSLSRQKGKQDLSGKSARTGTEQNSPGKFLFAVIDTGVGLSDELKPRLFTKGGRGKDSLKINVNSTGYGLSFVKGVIEAHNGRVWAESAGPGKGSQFYAELPAKA